MAATIDSTVGGADANSYIEDVATATAYFDERLNVAAWTAATSDEKTRALIQATRWLDTAEFEGVRVSQAQALKFPRYGATDQDGYEFDTASIPDIVQHATCELALTLLNAGSTDTLANTGLEAFANVKVGPIDVTPRLTQKAGEFPEHVKALLRPVLESSGMSGRVELA